MDHNWMLFSGDLRMLNGNINEIGLFLIALTFVFFFLFCYASEAYGYEELPRNSEGV